ncbi:hypothetical protein I6I10_06845 [Corynebacterium glucuronolyticum]|uniref:Uncharacterized protein n=1 Tax=Corynebacterium glucuronolyticum TaxID=39791 RepID=A0A7T4JW32_9CORY|nr:hypothetical protein [Corynebacterium glucuronolyticum]QQB45328.1 hypothetical protein I6I10_07220 [Corynebacterium glucuronolyticum]QQB47579.1 hypothetical protein I6I10_06845 [Corynebacterium glucuronolyticum]WKD64060.1 hypothetical protein CGLUCO_09075 [Corynebacterium glucuronolyticum DSM 44120]SMB82276.1 hypothetical protein SAMN05660745_02603 [Corynebacterium glucuronolyticum]
MTTEQKLRGRTRLAWATGALGFIVGVIYHAIISTPPVWIDQVATACQGM